MKDAVRRACVIGDPIAHSRSPMVHGFWLRELGIEGHYGREHVRSEDLSSFINGLRARGYRGCNVTLPHKEAALRLVDLATPLARALGAANTLWFEDSGALIGDNSDVHGFLANLDAEAPGWRANSKMALVLGAGGSTRAVVEGLVTAGVDRIVIANRSVERGAAIAVSHPRRTEAIGLGAAPAHLPGVDLLVNTTPLGMIGKPVLDFDLVRLKPDAVVADLVYMPLETPLLAQARRLGHPAVGGLGMLLHQAVPGFERWFGVRPEVTPALYRYVAADIAAGAARVPAA